MARRPAKPSAPRPIVQDGLQNVVTGLGTTKDGRTSTQYGLTLLTPDQLLIAYRTNWLARRIVDAFAEDATREWRIWQADEAQTEKIEEVEKQKKIQLQVKNSFIRARLYGGAALIMGIDGAGDVTEPLDLERVKKDSLKFVLPLSSYEMTRGQLIADATSEWFGRPKYYQINTGRADLGPNKEAAEIHPSRVIEFVGAEIPNWDIVNGTGMWGDSVLQIVDDVIKNYGTSLDSIAAMISDCKVDVFTIPGLTKKLASKNYEAAITRRVALSNQMKSTVNAILMDENEAWQRVQTSFAGLPDTMRELLKVVCGASGIPMTRLIGHAGGGGLGGESGGESDLHNYYDDVMSKQKNDIAPQLAPLDEVIERSSLGTFDNNIYYEWTPLYTPEPKEEAEIASSKATTFKADVDMGLINPDALRDARINQLIEDGTYPGLQDAIDEHGAEPEVEEPDEAMMAEHIGRLQKSSQQLQSIGKMAQPALPKPVRDAFNPDQPRDKDGQWVASAVGINHPRAIEGGGLVGSNKMTHAEAHEKLKMAGFKRTNSSRKTVNNKMGKSTAYQSSQHKESDYEHESGVTVNVRTKSSHDYLLSHYTVRPKKPLTDEDDLSRLRMFGGRD